MYVCTMHASNKDKGGSRILYCCCQIVVMNFNLGDCNDIQSDQYFVLQGFEWLWYTASRDRPRHLLSSKLRH